MALLVPNAGEQALLAYMLNKTAATNVKLTLFANNHTPAESSVVANFTEPTTGGYTAVSLTGASWTIAAVGDVVSATYAEQSFTFSTVSTVYGYTIQNSAGTTVLWAEAFGSPLVMSDGGGQIRITPKITAD
jgi:hypothetical protein